MKKRCKKCGELKPLTGFYRDTAARDGHRPECKACTSARRKAWYAENREREIARVVAWQQANPERFAERQRRYREDGRRDYRTEHLRRTFGLTQADYDALLAAQGGGCAICEDPPNEKISLHIDHDHGTGEIRGLLCVRCNNAIALLRESPDVMRRAIRYVSSDAKLRSQRPRLERLARDRALALKDRAA